MLDGRFNRVTSYADTRQATAEVIMDEHGYPETDDISWMKGELSAMDFHRGANAIKSLIDATGYGRATIGINPGRLEVATGGWSGCEEILSETRGTLWHMAFWESTHRGGLEVFLNTRTTGA